MSVISHHTTVELVHGGNVSVVANDTDEVLIALAKDIASGEGVAVRISWGLDHISVSEDSGSPTGYRVLAYGDGDDAETWLEGAPFDTDAPVVVEDWSF